MTRVGLIDPQEPLEERFVAQFLDHKQHVESVVVYELYKEGNHTLAVQLNRIVDQIINEHMLLKLLN